jgi:phage baseplate assembly protein W
MARNTRTFSDLDFNFIPSPIYSTKNDGIGSITSTTTSDIIVGTNTSFQTYDMLHRNIFVGTTFIGKVKETVDSTHLKLYKNANAAFTTQQFKYSNPADLVRRYDEQAVKTAVKNLILTINYERPFHPEIGTQVNALLFEPASPMTASVVEKTIRTAIENFEPRVNLDDVIVELNLDENSMDVTIQFTILNTQTPQILNLVLERTR